MKDTKIKNKAYVRIYMQFMYLISEYNNDFFHIQH